MTTSWTNITLGEITTAQYGLSVSSSEEGTVPILGMKNLQNGRIVFGELARVVLTPRDIENYRIHVGDILFNRTNSFDLVGKSSLVEKVTSEPTVFASYLVRLKVNESRALPAYVNYVLNSPSSEKRLKDMATPGVSQFNINPTSLRKHFRLLLPTLPEQKAIADVLFTWDQSIQHLSDLIAAKLRFKNGLMQQLLTGQRRFKDFETRDLSLCQLKDFLTFTARPTGRPSEAYKALGLRSHGKGTFVRFVEDPNQVQMDTLFQVKKDDLIVNITFAWEGAIAIVSEEDEQALVSHRFPTFIFDHSKALPEYLRQVVITPWFIFKMGLVSPGGAGRNRVLNKRDFLKIEIPLPEVDEQSRIATFLGEADCEITFLRKKLDALKQQKKGLMQKLLTGDVRVKQ